MPVSPASLTDYPERIAIAGLELVNEGWVRGAGESQVLFVVHVEGRSCGYLTVADDRTVLWIRELYLDGRTWRGGPKADAYAVLHRGLGKLILTSWEQQARDRNRLLGIFTTHSLGLLKACDHLFGDRCQYTVTEGNPPTTLFKQRGLRWLSSIESFSATISPQQVLVFENRDGEWLNGCPGSARYRLTMEDPRKLTVVELSTGRVWGPEDGLQVAIGPSVDIVVSR